MQQRSRRLALTVNFHFWRPCNMACKFCFAGFGDVDRESLLRKRQLVALTRTLAARFAKINFVGGEPTLCPYLPDLVREAKSAGAITSIVTNGTLLDGPRLAAFRGLLDMVGLSMDSAEPATNRATGRVLRTSREPLDAASYHRIADLVHHFGMALKINTVVSAANVHEDLTPHYLRMRPTRVKLLQLLPIAGENDRA
ncbi:MAG: radical SAM protein, partial [Planctomycetota bacterium]